MFEFKKLRLIFKLNKGFSLIELMVVLVIISIIGSFVYVIGQRQSVKKQLDLLSKALASDIRWAQNAALTGLEQPYPLYGYGVYIQNRSTYSIYYNRLNVTDHDYFDNNGGSEIIRTVTLPENYYFSSYNYSIFFKPLTPVTVIYSFLLRMTQGFVNVGIGYPSLGLNKNFMLTDNGVFVGL